MASNVKICANVNCKKEVFGRANQLYCTNTCKTATNNRRFAERNQGINEWKKNGRKNRSILNTIYNVCGNMAVPTSALTDKFDENIQTGVTKDGRKVVYDFAYKIEDGKVTVSRYNADDLMGLADFTSSNLA